MTFSLSTYETSYITVPRTSVGSVITLTSSPLSTRFTLSLTTPAVQLSSATTYISPTGAPLQ